ncbi:glycosyl transferase [Mucilaginibacter limnophilus]|uniref:Glycosyl transferase n=1 Tax=Mucilaginibacter limnophilus TaxID=1932778 RepID=A0A3S2UKI1_9SPHI|nr:glycosyltransferase family 39 protein [Mucilaginibacter limnophilus]RVT99866.1 glycosyl transferase [Mucilaginibacter limnophilus]
MQQTTVFNKWLYFFLLLAVCINLSGLCIPLMNPDATLYATIAKTMVLRNDYVNIIVNGTDWLDKPHFPFWIAALFFEIFGINTWAYKLSGIVFTLMAAVYTYKFAKALYNKDIALWSVLILLTAQHIILSDNDVRAEPYLTGLIIASVYHFYKAERGNDYWHLLAASLFAGCAVMTKGIFVLITIGGAIVGHLLITGQWKRLLHWRWLIAAVLTIIFTLPEIYCLYEQFDAHPEKIVFGQQGVSGIKFFLWDSQFGRFFNTGPIKGTGDPFFFVHTTLWAFLPWSLLLFAAIFQYIKSGVRNPRAYEWYCMCGGLITFLLFSASKFQLPHYLNIVFPFFAIITAQYFCSIVQQKTRKLISITQAVIIAILFSLVFALHYFYRPENINLSIWMAVGVLVVLLLVLPAKASAAWHQRIGFACILTAALVNVYLNGAFYSSLMKYQGGSEAAMWINKHNPQKLPVLQTGDKVNFAMEFYLDQPMINLADDSTVVLPHGMFMLYAPAEAVNNIASGRRVKPLKVFDNYPVTRLKPSFLNKKTRNQQLAKMALVLVDAASKN